MTIKELKFKKIDTDQKENINEILKRDTKKILITTDNGYYEIVDLPYHKDKFINDKRDEWFKLGAEKIKFTSIELKDSLEILNKPNYNEKDFINNKNI